MFAITDQIKTVRKEVERREKAFPRLVEDGRLKKDFADREIAAMRGALNTLEMVSKMAIEGLGDGKGN